MLQKRGVEPHAEVRLAVSIGVDTIVISLIPSSVILEWSHSCTTTLAFLFANGYRTREASPKITALALVVLDALFD